MSKKSLPLIAHLLAFFAATFVFAQSDTAPTDEPQTVQIEATDAGG
jgi:hypothetical protein